LKIKYCFVILFLVLAVFLAGCSSIILPDDNPITTTTCIIRLAGDLSFGSVNVGSTSQKTLTIYNDGNSTLTVSSISYPTGFSGSWSGTISAGSSRDVTVTFAPTQAFAYSGTLTVNSDKTSGTNTKSVSGTGTQTTTPQPSGIDDLYEILPDIQTCYEGILKGSEKQKVLEELNFIRSLHGLNPVSYDYEDDIYTAKAALIIVANEEMNHYPDQSYKCWTEEGEFGCSHSNLYMSWGWEDKIPKSEDFVIGWVVDEEVESLGHRRWMLFPFLSNTSYGRVDVLGFTGVVIKVINDKINPSNVDFVAYPYEEYPRNLFLKNWYLSFSVVADRNNLWNNEKVDFSDAVIEVNNEGGETLQVNSIYYDNEGYGIPNNLQWKVNGIKYGVKYTVNIKNVKVLGINKNYEYWFKLI
jgi:hypothetical protein